MPGRISIEGIVEYSRGQLECMAIDLLRRRVDIEFRAPINVEVLLEGTPNVHLEEMPGLLNQFSVEGAVCTEAMTHELTVFVDTRIMNGPDDARYGAVVAEELSHIILHRGVIQQIRSIQDFLEVRRCPQWKRIELDARHFSASVRMPELLVNRKAESVYQEVVGRYGFNDPHEVEKLVRNRLAELFVVPVADMHARIIQWPCPVASRVIASVEDRSSMLRPHAEQAPAKYSQRKLIEDG